MRTQRRKFCDAVMAAAAPAPTPCTAKNTQSGKTMAVPGADARPSGLLAANAGASAAISGTSLPCMKRTTTLRGVKGPATPTCQVASSGASGQRKADQRQPRGRALFLIALDAAASRTAQVAMRGSDRDRQGPVRSATAWRWHVRRRKLKLV